MEMVEVNLFALMMVKEECYEMGVMKVIFWVRSCVGG